MKKTKNIVLMAMLISLEIICSRFLSIQTPIVRIGFSFVPIAIAGMLLGPINAGVIGGISDILGLFLFGTGVFNIGITFNAILSGVMFGVMLKKPSKIRCCIAAGVNCIGISLFSQSFALATMYGMSYSAVLLSRIPQVIISLVVQILILLVLCKDSRVKNAYERI